MVSADCNATALLHCAVRVQNIVRCPSADIDHQCPEVFLMLRQNDLGGSEPAKNDILNVERQFFHAADRVLDPCPHTVNAVEIGLLSLADPPDRPQHAALSTD